MVGVHYNSTYTLGLYILCTPTMRSRIIKHNATHVAWRMWLGSADRAVRRDRKRVGEERGVKKMGNDDKDTNK